MIPTNAETDYNTIIVKRIQRIILDAVADTTEAALGLEVGEFAPPSDPPEDYNNVELDAIFESFHQCFGEREYFRRMLRIVRTLVIGYGTRGEE